MSQSIIGLYLEAPSLNQPPRLSRRLPQSFDAIVVSRARARPSARWSSFPNLKAQVPLANLKPRYVYDASAGSGQTVYIVDTGADLTHDVRLISRCRAFTKLIISAGIYERQKHRK